MCKRAKQLGCIHADRYISLFGIEEGHTKKYENTENKEIRAKQSTCAKHKVSISFRMTRWINPARARKRKGSSQGKF